MNQLEDLFWMCLVVVVKENTIISRSRGTDTSHQTQTQPLEHHNITIPATCSYRSTLHRDDSRQIGGGEIFADDTANPITRELLDGTLTSKCSPDMSRRLPSTPTTGPHHEVGRASSSLILLTVIRLRPSPSATTHSEPVKDDSSLTNILGRR